MTWPTLLNVVGYTLGLVGTILVIWSLLRQGVSLLGIALLTAGYLLLMIAGFIQ